MKKILAIAWKDLLVRFRDPGALVLLLVTPFALTLAIGFAFGGRGGSPLAGIPVAIVNRDTGGFGAYLVQTFESDDLAELIALTVVTDDVEARGAVDRDELAAVVIIPPDFSASLMSMVQGPLPAQTAPQTSVVEVYASPARPISVGVVREIVGGFLSQATAAMAGVQVSLARLWEEGLVSPLDIPALAQQIGERAWGRVSESSPIAVRSETAAAGSSAGRFDWAAYMTPSMAILFLMFTVTSGGRSLLAERDEGTLSRLLVSPTTAAQVLAGKALGTLFSGVVQVATLIAASSLLFGLRWGAPVALALVVLALAAAATGWGMLLAAYARTPGQANAAGTMLTLVFGALAGNFLPRQTLPEWLQTISYISPNAWGLEAFDVLTAGGNLSGLVAPLVALLVMAVALFGVSLPAFRRQYT